MPDVDLSRAVWRKSTRSGQNGGNCVEVAYLWHKSTRSSQNGGKCVEVGFPASAAEADTVGMRDSKDQGGPVLLFTRAHWQTFVAGVHSGQFDLRAGR